MEFFVINSLNGLAFGSVLFLVAAGFTLILGIMGVLQLAHGALYMTGAYLGWTIAIHYGLNWGLAILAGGLTSGLIGLVMERGCLRYLHRMIDEQVVLTWGFVYMLINLSLWIWGGVPRVPFTAPFLDRSVDFMGMGYPIFRVGLILIGLAGAVGLWWWQANSRSGAIVRAGMDDRETVKGLGINVERVSAIVFVFGASIAGVAGVLGAQLLGVYLALPFEILRFALAVTVVGGLGSIPGAFVGAMVIGFIDAFGRVLFPEFGMYIIFLVVVIVLLVRPLGILGTGRKEI